MLRISTFLGCRCAKTLYIRVKAEYIRPARGFRDVTSDAYPIAIERQGSLFPLSLLAAFCLLIMSLPASSCYLQWVCTLGNPGKPQGAWDYSANSDSFNDCLRDSSQCQTGYPSSIPDLARIVKVS